MSDLEFQLEDRILNDLVDEFVNGTNDIHVGSRTFRLAYFEETEEAGIDEDAVVLIEPASGDLYEMEIIGVSVRKIEPPKDEPVVDPNQLTLLDGAR